MWKQKNEGRNKKGKTGVKENGSRQLREWEERKKERKEKWDGWRG